MTRPPPQGQLSNHQMVLHYTGVISSCVCKREQMLLHGNLDAWAASKRARNHKEPLRRTFLLFLLMARCLRCPSGLCDPFPTMVPWHHNGPDIFDGIEVRVVAGRALLLRVMPLQPSRVPKKIEIAIIPNKPSIFDLKFVFAISDLFFNLRKQKKPPCWLARPLGDGVPSG